MSSYGEPWKASNRFGWESGGNCSEGYGGWEIETADERDLTEGFRETMQEGVAKRIVACVNALAGRDPEALAELEARIEAFTSGELCKLGWSEKMKQDWVRTAIAAFRKPPIAPVKDEQDA